MHTKRSMVATALLDKAESDKMCAVPTTASQRQAMRRALKRGYVVEPAPGIYARVEYWKNCSLEQQVWHKISALRKVHPEWIFAGATAGFVHGLSVGHDELKTVCVATSRRTHARQGHGITRIVVTNDNAVERNGVRVTSFVRTVYDCMRRVGFGQALAVADSALRAKGLTADRLARNLSKLCGRRSGLQRVLEVVALADGRSESGGESIARAAMMHIGVPLPKLQVEVRDEVERGRKCRIDFAWDLSDGTRVFCELDGKEKYVNPLMTGGKDVTDVLLDERRREAHVTVGRRPVKVMRVALHEVEDVELFEEILARYGIMRATIPVGVAREWP